MTDLVGENFVLLVDDLALKRAFIQNFLESWSTETGMRIVASDPDALLALRVPGNCKLVILSIGAQRLADARVLAAHSALATAHRDRPIIVLGDHPDTENVERAIKLGLAGYLPTSLDAAIAIAALNFVIAGGRYFPPDALADLGQPTDRSPTSVRQIPLVKSESQASTKPRFDCTGDSADGDEASSYPCADLPSATADEKLFAPLPNDLTSRQRQVLACLKRAQSNKEIARALEMSEATVKVHVRQVMKKLGALNRTHAAVLAINFVEPAQNVISNVAPFMSSKIFIQQAVRQ